jgi:hypothetical protein
VIQSNSFAAKLGCAEANFIVFAALKQQQSLPGALLLTSTHKETDTE